MIKKLRYLFTLMLLFVSSVSWAEDFTLTSAGQIDQNGITVTFEKGSGGTAPTWYAAGLRLYANNTITISSESNITGITFNWEKQGSKDFASAAASVGNYTHPTAAGEGTWSGSAKSVTFTIGSSGQLQLNTFSVVVEEGGTPVVSTPSFSPEAGAVQVGTKVTISTTTVDATIYYTTNGSTPNTSSTQGTSVTINEPVTIKAIAVKDGYNDSEVAEASYTIKQTIPGYVIDFENDLDCYVDWTFANIGRHTGTITAHGGSYYGSNANASGNGVANASIQTKEKVADPTTFTCYVSKVSNNTTSSTWYVDVSEDGNTWTEVKNMSATGMSKGEWQEFTANLSTYHNVYVRLRYDGSTALRAVDDISIVEGGTPIVVVTPPTFSPAAGEVVSGTEVTITAPEGCTVAYTTDGTTDPKEDLENAIRTEGNIVTIEITEDVTIKAVSVDSEENTSDVVEAAYTIKQETPQYETVTLPYEETLISSQGKFVIENVSLGGLTSVWKTSSYGMTANGYNCTGDIESWFVSPLIDATEAASINLTFDQNLRYFASTDVAREQATLWVREGATGTWSQLTIPTLENVNNNNFTSAGTIDLSSYAGKTIQLGFKYLATTTDPGRWELKNLHIQAGEIVIEYTDETIESLNGKTGASIDNVNLKLNNALVVYVDATQGAYVREGDYAIQFYKTGLELTAGQTLTGDIKFDYSPYKGLPEVKDIADVNTLDEVTVGTASVEPVVTTLAELAELTHVADLVKVENVTLSVDEDKYYMNVGEAQVQLFDKFGTNVIPTEIDETKVYNVTGVFGAIYNEAPEVFPTAIEEVADETVEVEIKAAATDGKGNYYSTLYYGDKNLVVPEGIEAYTYSVANGNIEESWMYSEGEVIPAATGVVLKTTTADTYYYFKVTTATGDEDPDNALLGTDGATTTTAPEGSTGDYKFYALSLDGNNTAGIIGFYYRKGCTNGEAFTNGAHKAYLAVPAGVAAKGYPFGGDETGINDINVNDNVNANDAIYSISGQRLQKLQRGINIVNGKKIVVK